jgi:glutathione-regulated potassium-efflux system ancillary protein KefG
MARALGDVEGVTVHDLYESYPDFEIDVSAEQEQLLAHDTIVVQHPLYWYSTPPLVKQWEDLVLEHGWAYGSAGTALQGKRAASAVSAGGREAAYGPEGRNRYSVQEFLRPIEATWRLCGVQPLEPFLVHGTHSLSGPDLDEVAARYRSWIEVLRDGGGEAIP